MTAFLIPAFVFLAASVVMVPIARRLGLGSVLGYLLAGMAIGPAIELVGASTEHLREVAEIGVVMMLFLIGLELEPRVLWRMRYKLVGMGGLQVGATALVLFAIGFGLGVDWRTALAIGLILSLSSTAIVLQTLSERELLRSSGGRAGFSILLFQDIAVVPILALLPFLALAPVISGGETPEIAALPGLGGINLLAGLDGWQAALVTIGAMAFVVGAGVFLSRPLFRFVASSGLREMLTAVALLSIAAIVLIMEGVGLSPALGAFIAGVVLANSEFRHELHADIEPFKALLVGLFFITVGAGIDFAVLAEDIWRVLAIAAGLIVVKFAVLYGVGTAFRLRPDARWLVALGLAQAGEFGFVLITFGLRHNVLTPDIGNELSLAIAVTMVLTPLLFFLFDRLVMPLVGASTSPEPPAIEEHAQIIIAGYGRFGQIVDRLLKSHGYQTIVLDKRADLVAGMRRQGFEAYYGDAARPETLTSAGLSEARLLVVAFHDLEATRRLITHARSVNKNIKIVARVHGSQHVHQLYVAGADEVTRETFDSALRAGRFALVSLGVHAEDARYFSELFADEDERMVKKHSSEWDPDTPAYLQGAYLEQTRRVASRVKSGAENRRAESVHALLDAAAKKDGSSDK
ncbi:MAG: cation:proton antiporter [Hyphomicrobiaceae bacterium]|nr:cation:proton antiporter [Hyphomicrobiaceae bacterium]MCC0023745.1 cation:proton antiporter [Hyphomicrobiaceae bacterium]